MAETISKAELVDMITEGTGLKKKDVKTVHPIFYMKPFYLKKKKKKNK